MILKLNDIFLCKLLILIISIKTFYCDETIEVKLNQGVLSGKVEKTFLNEETYYSFRGVPYAKPPTGDLRFLPPVKHESWDDTYEAYKNKPTCLQFNSRMRNGEPFGISGCEDCLYLSVFTPQLDGSAPVVVFDYNDNFRTGFNGTDTYSPDFFIEEGVIVVTITHRLGLFGYLTTEDDVIPGNAGIKDFILGLRWVKDNIEKFGGDRSKVTLMGNRGGAAIADILLYSEKAKDLFSGVIMQSGTVLEAIYFFDNPRQKAFELAEALDIKTNDSSTLLEELQKIDAEKLINEEFTVIDSEGLKKFQMSIFPFSPIVEKDHTDAVLTFAPDKGTAVNDVPVIIGLNSREGLDLASHFIFEPRMLPELSQHSSFHFPIRSNFRFDRDSSVFVEVSKEINNFYYKEGYLNIDNILDYAVYIGDTLQNYALDHAAKKMANELSSPVFYYMFDFRGSLNENSEYMTRFARSSMKNWGATLGDELCYLHLCSRIKKNYGQLKKMVSEHSEIKVLKKMVRMWTNFAKTRNPTPDKDNILKDFIWQPIDKNNKNIKYLHITKNPKMKVNPLGKRAKFWDDFLDKYSKMAANGVVGDELKINDKEISNEETNNDENNSLDLDDAAENEPGYDEVKSEVKERVGREGKAHEEL